jgi:hypothetical protein
MSGSRLMGVYISPDSIVRYMFVVYLTWSSEQQAMSRNRRDVRCGFLFGALEADVPNWSAEFLTSPIEKLIPNQSVLALTARVWALQNRMSHIPKIKEVLRVGSGFWAIYLF